MYAEDLDSRYLYNYIIRTIKVKNQLLNNSCRAVPIYVSDI